MLEPCIGKELEGWMNVSRSCLFLVLFAEEFEELGIFVAFNLEVSTIELREVEMPNFEMFKPWRPSLFD